MHTMYVSTYYHHNYKKSSVQIYNFIFLNKHIEWLNVKSWSHVIITYVYSFICANVVVVNSHKQNWRLYHKRKIIHPTQSQVNFHHYAVTHHLAEVQMDKTNYEKYAWQQSWLNVTLPVRETVHAFKLWSSVYIHS